MHSNLPPSSTARQADTFSPAESCQGDSVSLSLRLLRRAIDETGWKHEAIAAALRVSGKYLSRMLSAEKAFTERHVRLLPDEVERRFLRLRAEEMGLVVVEPLNRDDAVRALVSGLVGVLTPRLPAKATQLAKADLKVRADKAVG